MKEEALERIEDVVYRVEKPFYDFINKVFIPYWWVFGAMYVIYHTLLWLI